MAHKVSYTYARGRVRVTCSCGEAQTKWMPPDTPRRDLHEALKRAHPQSVKE
jgi:hypothetical protein